MRHPTNTLAVLSGITSIASWQEQLDWGLRVAAAIIAIAAGLLSIWHRLKRKPSSAPSSSE